MLSPLENVASAKSSQRSRQRSVLSTKYSVLGTFSIPLLSLTTLLLLCAARASAAQDNPSPPAGGILLTPHAFRAAAAKVQPSLVKIEGFGGIAPGSGEDGYQAAGEGPTTGLIISSDGYILTSTFNFLRKPPVITVLFAVGRRHVAKLLGRDETRKICLLKVDGVSNLPVPEAAPRSELKVGQWAVALGVGFGAKEPAVSAGVISATSRVSGKAVQTDANTSPANYGGPLIDLDGRVIGVCVPLSPGSREDAAGAQWYDSGIGFAIPLDGLGSVIDRLKASETLRYPFLGVQLAPHGNPPTGAVIKEVIADSPAAKAGLQPGDKILSIAGTAILDVPHLATVLNRYNAADKIDLLIKRGDEERSITAELTFPPPDQVPAAAPNVKAGEPKPGPPRPPPKRPPM